MIKIIENGNLFDSKCQTITNAINVVGVMGKGIALEFKKRYPDYYLSYKSRCEANQVKVGNVYLYKKPTIWILSFPTKDHWRNNSKMSYIETGLDDLVADYAKFGITSLALPALGCANGGLEWADVKDLIVSKLEKLPITIELYAPID